MKIKFFDLAQKVSKKSTHRQFHLGSVIVKKNKVISIGFNQAKTHPKSTHRYNQIHAELDAIISAERKELRNCDIYIYREQADGRLAISKPCSYCESAILKAGIRRVFYTDDGQYKQLILKD